jgi:hypothetical protein
VRPSLSEFQGVLVSCQHVQRSQHKYSWDLAIGAWEGRSRRTKVADMAFKNEDELVLRRVKKKGAVTGH